MMMMTKTFVLLVITLVCVNGLSLQEGSEKKPAKSEIMLRIKRLLEMLREKEESKPATHEEHVSSHTPNSVESQRRHMLERRRKLEVLLKRNPGLRTLLKRVLEKRKIQELKKSQSDAQNCIPGLFYCRDESKNEEVGRRREILKKIINAKREDSSKYCPPGFFYCPKSGNDESERKSGNEKEEFLKEMFPKRFTQRGQSTKEMQDLDSIVKLSKKQREYHPRHKAEQHNVEFVREPASVRKVDEADESTKGKRTHHGDKLADDLMKSLQDTDKKSTDMSAADKESNFDLKQLIELFKE